MGYIGKRGVDGRPAAARLRDRHRAIPSRFGARPSGRWPAATVPDNGPRTQDTANQTIWSQSTQVARFASADGWIDRSERALVERLQRDDPGGDVLDIGVGGGRTVPLLSKRATSYVGIDFVPELVAAAKQRFPDVDLRVGDARDLDFPTASFDKVVFSINGLDAVSHADRAIALAEIRRVLRPTGVFLFSTHNHNGPGPHERPWTLPPMSLRQPRSSARTFARRVMRLRASMKNYRSSIAMTETGPDWMVTISGAHDFQLVVHYITATALQAELRAAGFLGPIELWDDRAGVPAAGGRSQDRWWYFNVMARCSTPALTG